MTSLYITEKPDVGRALADFLARKAGTSAKKGDGFIEIPGVGDVTWCIGHLLEQAGMDFYLLPIAKKEDIKDGKVRWKPEYLPCLPSKMEMLPSGDKKKQIEVIRALVKKASEIIHSADRDREGQSIVDELLEHFGTKGKPVRRLVFSALDDHSIADAMSKIESNDLPKFRNMGLASKARSWADWAIGLNATRICTALHSPGGVVSVGRVQTPTLAVIVKRYMDVMNFKPVKFYVPVVTLPDGIVLEWRKMAGDEFVEGMDSEGRIIDEKLARRIVDKINAGTAGVVTDASSKEKKQAPPLPFSLDAIRSEMSRRHGLSVDQTTKACQSLYEKKMQTYVGTDCRYLPESMHGEALHVLKGLMSTGLRHAAESATPTIKYGCWNDSKITAHHAIIPTGVAGKLDSEAEKLVYDAVCRRYLAQFHPEYKYLEARLEANYGGSMFSASRKDPVAMGWKAVENVVDDDQEDVAIAAHELKNSIS